MDNLLWVGIAFCITQSAIFSGLNLAFFSISRIRLEAESASGNQRAAKILTMRKDSNFLLTTILWGNVGINVLLTLLSNSAMAGFTAFIFSTVVITFLGEIIPQAYFSRNAMFMGSLLSPVLRLWQFILYPVAKPSAWMLDTWLGKESMQYMQERQLKGFINQHIISDTGEIDFVEGRGALNFLDIDDIPISDEGEPVNPGSIISLPVKVDLPILPELRSIEDPFIRLVNASEEKWVIITDQEDMPRLVLNADSFIRALLNHPEQIETMDAYTHCHRPIVVTDPKRPLGSIIGAIKEGMATDSDAAIDKDIVLLWTDEAKRVITGADLLGRLLFGIDTASIEAAP